ncbi:ficolin-2-like [Cochliomyia hominivorax]
MNIRIFILSLFVINDLTNGRECEDYSSLTYVDEIVVLKKIFKNLNDLKIGIDQCNNLRYEERPQDKELIINDPSIFDIRYDTLPAKCKSSSPPKSCAEATSCTQRSGIYKILLEKYSSEPFLVECDVKTDGGGWILIQRRQDGSIDFYRNWLEYQKGFGNIDGEFFIGLNKLHALTNYNGPQELLIVLEDKDEIKQAKYSNFVVGNESEDYALKHLGVYSGDAGDSLFPHLLSKFSTKDRDNDEYDTNCAELFTGAWWYKKCHVSNLNGKYGDTNFAKGITWHTFRGYNISVKHVKMMIRRRRF